MSFKRYADTVRTCMMAGVSMGLLFTAVSAYAVTAHQPDVLLLHPAWAGALAGRTGAVGEVGSCQTR